LGPHSYRYANAIANGGEKDSRRFHDGKRRGEDAEYDRTGCGKGEYGKEDEEYSLQTERYSVSSTRYPIVANHVAAQ